MEDTYLNDEGQLAFKLSRSEYEKFVSILKGLIGLSIDKCFFDSDEDYFDVTLDVKNTDLPF